MQKITLMTGFAVSALATGTAFAIPMTTFTQTTANAGAIVDDSALVGTVTNQMFVQPSGGDDWTNSEILIKLTSGTVYNATGAAATDSSPNPALYAVTGFRNGAFDTFVTGGGFAPATIAGASSRLGGPGGAFTLGPAGVDVSWGDTNADDLGNTFVSQFTLSADAIGTYTGISLQTGAVVEEFSGTVAGGVLFPTGTNPPLPEPASLGLLGLGGLALLRRRRA